ncbi:MULTISPECIES: 8-oxoguanine deaminase [Streptomyces]|uniref:8-oxoguanine deaminase n=1 Tax=Streptomyces cinereoruber TaxID=67260 RepID=A0AAV4KU48_9ACTN|nr:MULTISPECIES: 8-oxoguanine deaminase [Streptomyces]MBB4157581.1 cytosine/adenosine deaminase-related metal-dependent hydrolase [Streptomyces cinereoruber]MBY8819946.1 8-oxoguanine deaminase [Streptomyces cinereoruber]NIH62266.1 cytosine/adenosine deaminase-related metal-dependent hydrolase [Streptomyces cinereoruber]PVC77241.1 8-oxoguanine deaminase [Streptomyces sp. CS081A]QEV35471.1 8-oxoguanine deaminase [Streptomyces cinereoruber]
MAAPSAAPQRIVVENAAIATVDANDTEYASGYLVVADNKIESIGAGKAPEGLENVVRRIDATGHLVTPGLVNTHHHFYQWITRGLATDHNLFNWLVALYPTWARIDEQMVRAAAQGSLAMMARGGVTTAMDHHYVYPVNSGDLSGAIIGAASEMGVRFTLARGSMDRSEKDGGLPPDFAVETTEGALAATEETVKRYHDASFDAMTQVAVAPCSPFSISTELLREGAALGRRLGVRMHTHGSETVEEEKFCHELFGMGPTDYFESTGFLGEDVWMAHCVHMNDSDIAAFARTKTGVAHCPSSNARLAAGIARVPDMLAAGVPVGLGVDGTASNESGELHTELRNALLINRLGAHREAALNARQALRLGTHGGAQVLGRADSIGSLEAGKLADFVLWKIDGLGHSTIADPVTAIVFGAAAPVTASFVNGRQIVENDRLLTVDEDAIARDARTEAQRLARIAAQA